MCVFSSLVTYIAINAHASEAGTGKIRDLGGNWQTETLFWYKGGSLSLATAICC